MGVPVVGLVRNSPINAPTSFMREAYFLYSGFASRLKSSKILTSQFGEVFFGCLKLFSSGDVFVDIMNRFL